MIAQLSFLPDIEPREEIPLVIYRDGRWMWRVVGSDEYRIEPELERILIAAQRRKAV